MLSEEQTMSEEDYLKRIALWIDNITAKLSNVTGGEHRAQMPVCDERYIDLR